MNLQLRDKDFDIFRIIFGWLILLWCMLTFADRPALEPGVLQMAAAPGTFAEIWGLAPH